MCDFLGFLVGFGICMKLIDVVRSTIVSLLEMGVVFFMFDAVISMSINDFQSSLLPFLAWGSYVSNVLPNTLKRLRTKPWALRNQPLGAYVKTQTWESVIDAQAQQASPLDPSKPQSS
ncbi:Uncharacterized protein TCM_017521 [Theobroma cacao]|uniref:Uncharacterized protein n=1 Tax=Theobroma cacao TaxID=3641 RepID=A0A061EFB0_THECC|nr:Uncharacterized protein TCM_017521 [Theobroma cacao]